MEQKAIYVESDCRNWKRDKINSTLDARTAELDGSGSHASRVAKKKQNGTHIFGLKSSAYIVCSPILFSTWHFIQNNCIWCVAVCARARLGSILCSMYTHTEYQHHISDGHSFDLTHDREIIKIVMIFHQFPICPVT